MNVSQINHQLLEICPAGILILNKGGEIEYANKNAENIFGLSRDEIIGQKYNSGKWKITDFEGGNFPENQLPLTQVLTKNQSVFNIEHAIEFSGARKAFLSVNAALINNEKNEVEGAILTLEDVGNKILSIADLAKSEKRYNDLFENLTDEVHIWKYIKDKNGDVVNWRLESANSIALKNWGKKKSEVEGKTALDLFGKEALDLFKPIINKLLKSGEAIKWEAYSPPTNQILAMGSVSVGDSFISTGHDISNFKNAEKQLQLRKDQAHEAKEKAINGELNLKQTQSIAKVGGWEYDMESELFLFNDNFYEIFRTSVEKIGGYTMTAEEYAKRFIPAKDRAIVTNEIQKAIETDNPDFSQYLEQEVHFDDGEIGYFGVKYFIVKKQEGKDHKNLWGKSRHN